MIDVITVIFASIMLKLSSSIDDPIWLTKLVYNEDKKHRIYIEVTYLFSLTFITIFAYIFSITGNEISNIIFGSDIYFPLLSSFILILFAIFHVRKEHNINIFIKKNSFYKKIMNSFIISTVGSFDELVVFTTMLSLKEISFYPLLIGTLIAGMMILFLVQGITKFKIITIFISKIPTWYIILSLGIFTFIYSLYNIFII